MNKNTNAIERLKILLKTLFQFDAGELDFGIYRIMNHRRKEIENFIENDLIQVVEKEFEKYKQQSNE
jgi:adenine-specific DNA-methyltransferase